VDRGGPNVEGEEDKMEDKIICHKGEGERKKNENRTSRIRGEVMEMGGKRGANGHGGKKLGRGKRGAREKERGGKRGKRREGNYREEKIESRIKRV